MDKQNSFSNQAKEILSVLNTQQKKDIDKISNEFKKELTRNKEQIIALREQVKLLKNADKKSNKLTEKNAKLESALKDSNRRLSKNERAVAGIKREYKKKFDNFRGKRASGNSTFMLGKSNYKSFNKLSADSSKESGLSDSDFGELGSLLSGNIKKNKVGADYSNRLESVQSKRKQQEALNEQKKLKEQDKVTKNLSGMDKQLSKVNTKLNLFALALMAKGLYDGLDSIHKNTREEAYKGYRAGLHLKESRAYDRVMNALGISPEDFKSGMQRFKEQKDLWGQGGKFLTEGQQRLLVGGTPYSLGLNPADLQKMSPQDAYMYIMRLSYSKAQSNPNNAGALVAGLKESEGFEVIGDIIQTALMTNMPLGEVISKFEKASDVPLGYEERISQASLVWEEATIRVSNAASKLADAFLQLTTPILKLINLFPSLASANEREEERAIVKGRISRSKNDDEVIEALNSGGLKIKNGDGGLSASQKAALHSMPFGNLAASTLDVIDTSLPYMKKGLNEIGIIGDKHYSYMSISDMIRKTSSSKNTEADYESGINDIISMIKEIEKNDKVSKEYKETLANYLSINSKDFSFNSDGRKLNSHLSNILKEGDSYKDYDKRASDLMEIYKSNDNAVFNHNRGTNINELSKDMSANEVRLDGKLEVNVKADEGLNARVDSSATLNGNMVQVTEFVE